MSESSTVTSPVIQSLLAYIEQNRDKCRRCGTAGFWVSTAKGKRILMDFPNKALHPEGTHELVWGSKDREFDGTVEAWPKDHGTHTVHFDTCEYHTHPPDEFSTGISHSHYGGRDPHDHNGFKSGPTKGANYRRG